MYICQSQSPNSSHPPFPPWCPYVCSQRLCLYFCLANRFICTIFLDAVYALIYDICFSLSDLLHSVWQPLGPSASLQMTQFHSFLWLSNIPFYICTTTYLSIHLSMDIYLGCFHDLPVVNSAAVNIGVHVSFWITVFSGYMPSSGIAGSLLKAFCISVLPWFFF